MENMPYIIVTPYINIISGGHDIKTCNKREIMKYIFCLNCLENNLGWIEKINLIQY